MNTPKKFPVRKKPYGGATIYIPWEVAEKAYAEYASRFGNSQSLERLAERGGFCVEEMDLYYPEWMSESEVSDEANRF